MNECLIIINGKTDELVMTSKPLNYGHGEIWEYLSLYLMLR